ncbi:hypothetical protein IV84_GL001229 [Pediococcus damnosus]|nr:hypothetical protein IV84_GL001229 [Pediococcus damnosus]
MAHLAWNGVRVLVAKLAARTRTTFRTRFAERRYFNLILLPRTFLYQAIECDFVLSTFN